MSNKNTTEKVGVEKVAIEKSATEKVCGLWGDVEKPNIEKPDVEKSDTKSNGVKSRMIIFLLLGDLLGAAVSLWLSRTIMFFSKSVTDPISSMEVKVAIGMLFVIVLVAMLLIFDCYNTVWKYAGRVEFLKFLFAYIATFLFLFVFGLVVRIAFSVEVWAPLIIMYLLFSALLSGSARFFNGMIHYIKHIGNKYGKQDKEGRQRAVIVGAGYTGSLVVNRFINNPQDGYFPVALIDDDETKHGSNVYGVKVLGGMNKLGWVVADVHADVIVIAISTIPKFRLKEIYNECRATALPVKIMPAMTDASANILNNPALSIRDVKIEELLGREEFKVKSELIDLAVKDLVVCVTGGAGSIGSELCRQALGFGCKHLIIFDNHENGMFALDRELADKFGPDRYTLVIGTVRERGKLAETFAKYRPDAVFHAAAYKHVPMMEISAAESVKNNVLGTRNVIEEAEKAGVKKFVLISTDKAVNPANVMGASKRIAEMVVQTLGKRCKMKMAAVRFGNVLGSNGSVIPIFLQQIKDGGPITLTDNQIKRYFMTIPEAVRLVLQTGAFADSGEIFVLDMGSPVLIRDLACDLIKMNGLVPDVDIKIKVTGLRPGEKLFEELRYDKEMVDTTAHEGIFVTRMEDVDAKVFGKQLAALEEAAAKDDSAKTEDIMFEIVPDASRIKAKKDREEQLVRLNAEAEGEGD